MRPWLIAAALLAPLPAQAASTLRFALDFDSFDSVRSGSYIERIVNLSMCDQLLDLDASLKPDLTLRELLSALHGRGIAVSYHALWNIVQRGAAF